MITDEKQEKQDVGRPEKRWDPKRKVLYRAFRNLFMERKRSLKAVHSTWKNMDGNRKKVLCFAQISGSDGTVRCDIVDDRVNGESRCISQWNCSADKDLSSVEERTMWSGRILPAYKEAGSHHLPTGALWSLWKICRRKGTGYSARTAAYEICVRWWLRANRSQSGGLCIHRRYRHRQSDGDPHL